MVFVCFCYPLKTNKGFTITRKTFDFHLFKFRAEDGTQTRDPQLGRLMLYQLSYFRNLHSPMGMLSVPRNFSFPDSKKWAVMDSNHRRHKPADLQSAPFGHSGNCPVKMRCKDTFYFFFVQTLREKSIIFMAVTAASSPLFPYRPPERSSACCIFSVVNMPKMNGIPY